MMMAVLMIYFERGETGMAASAVQVRTSLEGFVQKTFVEGTFPGSAERLDVDFLIGMAADGRAVAGNADTASVPGS